MSVTGINYLLRAECKAQVKRYRAYKRDHMVNLFKGIGGPHKLVARYTLSLTMI